MHTPQAAAILLFGVLSFSASSVSASVTYSYTGNTYTAIEDSQRPAGAFDTSMRISGSFEVASALAPNLTQTDISALLLAFSFSDGRSTLTHLDIAPLLFELATDASGNINAWVIVLSLDDLLRNDPQQPHGSSIDMQMFFNDEFQRFANGDLAQLAVCAEFDPPGICHTTGDVARVVDSAGRWQSTTPQTPVSEPTDLALGAFGLLALAGLRRRLGALKAQRA